MDLEYFARVVRACFLGWGRVSYLGEKLFRRGGKTKTKTQ